MLKGASHIGNMPNFVYYSGVIYKTLSIAVTMCNAYVPQKNEKILCEKDLVKRK